MNEEQKRLRDRATQDTEQESREAMIAGRKLVQEVLDNPMGLTNDVKSAQVMLVLMQAGWDAARTPSAPVQVSRADIAWALNDAGMEGPGRLKYAEAIFDLLNRETVEDDTGLPQVPKAEVVTICGSTKFKEAIMAENARLTTEGKVVISLGLFGHTDLPDYNWDTDASDLKTMLDALHAQKIDMADRVHVVNVGGYYGESTTREIAYARTLGKPITFMEVVQGDAQKNSSQHECNANCYTQNENDYHRKQQP